MAPHPMLDRNNRDYALRILARRNNTMEALIKFGELRQVIELNEVQSAFPLVNLQIDFYCLRLPKNSAVN